MGASESREGGRSGDDSDDGDEWMQADKYAEWTCADSIDYNGTAMTVRHVEMPLDKNGRERLNESKTDGMNNSGSTFGGLGFSHEALVFDVMSTDGRVTKFTVEFTFSGVLKRWGHHKFISAVKGYKNINLPMSQVLEIIKTSKPYCLISYNCKHYAEDKLKQF